MKRSLPLWNSFFALTLLLACSSPKSLITKHTEQFYTIDASLGKDSLMQAFLSPYKKGVDTIMQGVLAYSDVPLTKAQPECTMGNLIADAQLVSARKIDSNVTISVVNYGGVRINFIAAGAITRGLVYEVMPFENKIAIVTGGGSGLGMSIMAGVISKAGGELALRKSSLGGLAIVAQLPAYRQ